MDDTSFDIAMLFVLKDGSAVWAESTMDKFPDDPLMQDFQPITDYNDYSNFFEVTEFSFSLAVKAAEESVGAMSRPGAGNNQHQAHASSADGAFDRWRSAVESEYRKIKFPLSFDTFSFSRVIDGASPTFFQACARQESFRSAALIKRVSGSRVSTKGRQALAFMRFDFRDVMLKSLSWDDGDLVTERCTFTCKEFDFRYRQQNPDGSLGQEKGKASWKRDRDSRVSGAGGQ